MAIVFRPGLTDSVIGQTLAGAVQGQQQQLRLNEMLLQDALRNKAAVRDNAFRVQQNTTNELWRRMRDASQREASKVELEDKQAHDIEMQKMRDKGQMERTQLQQDSQTTRALSRDALYDERYRREEERRQQTENRNFVQTYGVSREQAEVEADQAGIPIGEYLTTKRLELSRREAEIALEFDMKRKQETDFQKWISQNFQQTFSTEQRRPLESAQPGPHRAAAEPQRPRPRRKDASTAERDDGDRPGSRLLLPRAAGPESRGRLGQSQGDAQRGPVLQGVSLERCFQGLAEGRQQRSPRHQAGQDLRRLDRPDEGVEGRTSRVRPDDEVRAEGPAAVRDLRRVRRRQREAGHQGCVCRDADRCRWHQSCSERADPAAGDLENMVSPEDAHAAKQYIEQVLIEQARQMGFDPNRPQSWSPELLTQYEAAKQTIQAYQSQLRPPSGN